MTPKTKECYDMAVLYFWGGKKHDEKFSAEAPGGMFFFWLQGAGERKEGGVF